MVLYTIEGLTPGVFLERPNRYVAKVALEGAPVTVHVHDPGRLRELLYEGNPCLIRYAASETRKTDWDMIAAAKADDYVLIHSGYHRYIAEALIRNEALNPFGEAFSVKAEVKHENSRIDFKYVDAEGRNVWVEVKGCSLSEDGVAKFPDAPTVRGTKHLRSLIDIKASGDRACVLILVLSASEVFAPKVDTDPKFAACFYEALEAGVEIAPIKVLFDPETGALVYKGRLPIMPKAEAYALSKGE